MNNTLTKKTLTSSYKDPSGFIFTENDILYRQVNDIYKENYDFLMASGLYEKLSQKGFLISHEEIPDKAVEYNCYKVIKPRLIDFISYPYEWCFSQYKDAALLTLKIQKTAIEYGMSLKDATSYNVQFLDGKPIFIDTLSFEKFDETKPWIAYKQFCQHFAAPLALMSKKDFRLGSLMKNYIDGVPLDLASELLPKFSGFGIFSHIHLHAKAQKKYEASHSTKSIQKVKLSKFSHLALIDSLESLIKSLKWNPKGTEWGEYYTFTNYDDEAFNHKKKIINDFIDEIKPFYLWDVGANNGLFTRIASDKSINSIAFDIDPVAVEVNYTLIKKNKENCILPLVMDLTNPSPSIGWANCERDSYTERSKADTVMALALIHHLAISNNLPFENIAEFFSNICKNLIIEFVPKEDSQVKILLSTREDIFPNYKQEYFVEIFSKYFKIEKAEQIKNSKRTIYLMKNKKKEK